MLERSGNFILISPAHALRSVASVPIPDPAARYGPEVYSTI